MISPEFKANVAKKDVFSVRSALVDYLIIDISAFNQAFAYAQKFLPVVVPHDDEIFAEKKEWNEAYLNQQKTALMFNFSQERIDHLKDVIQEVYAAKGGAEEKPSQLKEAVEKEDVFAARAYLVTCLEGSKQFAVFDSNLDYANKNLHIMQKHDGEIFESEENWNKTYLDDQCAKLYTNFSRERIQHIKAVISKIYPVAVTEHTQKKKEESAVFIHRKRKILDKLGESVKTGMRKIKK